MARLASASSFLESFLKARVVFAVETLVASAGMAVKDQVYLTVKPSRSVFANKDLAAGELVLLPEACQVRLAKDEEAEDLSEKGSVVEVFDESAVGPLECRIFLVSQGHAEAVCPFWCIEHASVLEETNLVQILYKVQVVGGCDPWLESADQVAKRLATQPLEASPSRGPAKAETPSDAASSKASEEALAGEAKSDQSALVKEGEETTVNEKKPAQASTGLATVKKEEGMEPVEKRRARLLQKSSPGAAKEAKDEAKLGKDTLRPGK